MNSLYCFGFPFLFIPFFSAYSGPVRDAVSFPAGVMPRIFFSACGRAIIIWCPQPRHFIFKSMPTRKSSHSRLPHGCCFFIFTISPTSSFNPVSSHTSSVFPYRPAHSCNTPCFAGHHFAFADIVSNSSASGNVKIISVPLPTSLFTSIDPPWRSAICFAIASPSPEPFAFCRSFDV